MRLIRTISLVVIGMGLTINSLYAQNCDPGADGITPVGGGPQQLANGDVCANAAVVPATMKILYTNVDDGGNPNLVEFLIDWDDGTMETLTFAGGDITQPAFPPSSYEATITHFFPANGGAIQCEYIPITFLQFNGIGTCAGSAASPPAFVRWNTDDQLTGQHLLAEQATGVQTFQVCAGQAATVRFSDQSTFNCVPPAYMNLVNDRTRWTQFIYGTNNTITGPTGVLVDGNLEVYPFNGAVLSQVTPVSVTFAVTLDITVPADAQVGEEFEITMNSWNFCNQNGVDPPIVITARILIIDSPPAPVAPVADFCVGTNPILTVAGTGGTLTWYSDPGLAPADIVHIGATINASTDPPVADQLNNGVPGSKTYYVTETLGVNNCEGPATTVIFTMIENPTTSNAGVGFPMCSATSQLSGNNPVVGTGVWTWAGGTANVVAGEESNFNANIENFTQGTTTTFTWTITNGGICVSFDVVNITRDQLPSVADAGPNVSLCNGTSTTLQAVNPTGGSIGTWTVTAGTGTIAPADINNPNAPITGLTLGAITTLEWEVNNGTCTPPAITPNISTVQITSDLDPPADAGGDANFDIFVCGTTTVLNGSDPTPGTGLWVYVSGSGNIMAGQETMPNATAQNLVVGDPLILSWDVTNGVCFDSDPLQVNMVPTAVSNPGPNTSICSFSYPMVADPLNLGLGETGLWSISSGSGTIIDSSDPLTLVTNLGLGPNIFIWTVTNACGPSAPGFVTITNNSPPLANAGPDQIFCSNIITSAILAANDPSILDPTASGSWFKASGAGGTFTPNNTTATATFDGNLGETYILEWTVTNPACGDQPLDAVTIQFNNQPVANAGLGGFVCGTGLGNPFALLASPTFGNGTWTNQTPGVGTATFSDPSLFDATVTVNNPGTYTFRWAEDNNGCTNFQEIFVDYYEIPTADAGAAAVEECSLVHTLGAIQSVGGSTGNWIVQVAGPGIISFDNANLFNATSTATLYGTYTLRFTETNGGVCSDFDDIVVTFTQQPISNAGSGGDECDLDFVLGAIPSVLAPPGLGTWSMDSGPGAITGFSTNANDPVATVTVDTYGTYVFRWTELNGVGCTDFDVITVNFFQQPVAVPGVGGIFCSNSVMLGATPSAGIGTWTALPLAGASFDDPNLPNATFTGNFATLYTLTWEEVNGICNDNNIITVEFDQTPTMAMTANPTISVCTASTNLNGNVAVIGNGLWDYAPGGDPDRLGIISNNTSETSLFTGTSGLTYTLRWTISTTLAACASTFDDVAVSFGPTIAQPTINGDTEACVNDTKTYVVFNPDPVTFNYIWDTSLLPGSTVELGSGSPFQFITITFNQDFVGGTLSVTPERKGDLCIGTAGTFNITVFETPIMSLTSSSPSLICAGDVVTFTASDALSIADNYEFLINGVTVQSSASDTYTTSTLSNLDQVVVTGTAGGVCPDSTSPPIQFTVDPLPIVFNVQGGGSYCLGGSGVTVGLDGSEPAITYELYMGGNPTGTTLTPGGGGFNFPPQVAAGIYTIEAVTVPNCPLFMAGNTTITIDPLPTIHTVNGGGDICSDDPGARVNLNNSDLGIDYQLMKDGFPIGIILSGTGASLDFGLQTVAGTYTIEASDVNTLCTMMMLGNRDVTIFSKPSVLATNNTSSICTGSDTNIQLNSNVIGTTFTWTVTVSDVFLTGATDQSMPQIIASSISQTLSNTSSVPQTATYSILPTGPLPTSCAGDVLNIEVIVNPEPAASISGNTTICNGTSTSIMFDMAVGELPFDLVYTDGVSNFNLNNIASPHVVNVSPTVTTNYSLVSVTDVNGCSVNSPPGQAIVTVEDAIADFATSQPASSCNPYPVTFTNNSIIPGVTYEWSWGDGTTNDIITTETTITHEFENSSTTATLSYSIVLTATNNNVVPACTDISSSIIEVFPSIVVDVIPDVTESCGPVTVNFDNRSLGVAEHRWFVRRQGVDEENDVRTTPFVTYVLDNNTVDAIVYEVVYTATKGTCFEELITPINVYPNLQPSFTVAPGNQVLITDPPHATITNTTPNANSWIYEWDMGDGSPIITDVNPGPYTYNAFGIYEISLTISDPNSPLDCSQKVTFTIEVSPVFPIVDFTLDKTEGCRPLTVNFSNLSQFVDPDTYFWQFINQNGELIGDSQIENPSFTFFDPGFYTVSLDGSNPLGNAANETKEMIIRVNDIPTVSFAIRPTTVFLPDQPIFTDNSTIGADIFVWDFGDSTVVEEFEPQHVYIEEGLFSITLTATSIDGCENSETKPDVVTVLEGGTTRLPNAFTPSLDGPSGGVTTGGGASGSGSFNDVFLPITEGVTEFNLQIFDRWGNLMFESNNKTIGWDGYTTNGKLVPQGVYVYKTVMKFVNGEKTTRVGDVTVIR